MKKIRLSKRQRFKAMLYTVAHLCEVYSLLFINTSD